MLRFALCQLCSCSALLALTLCHSPNAWAQPTITHAQPAAILPLGTTRVVLHGDKLTVPLRVWTSTTANVHVVDVQPQKAVIDITPQQELALGPVGLVAATGDGVAVPLALLVDSLPSTPEQPDNHSSVTAQTVGMSAAVDALSDGKQLDFFRFHADAGQEITFEVLAQHLGSNFDAVVRVLSEDARELRSVDDDAISPDCRFRHSFENSGNYLLEIHDNRFTAGGRYRLRLGNFPIVSSPFPAVVQRGTCAQFSFAGVDRTRMAAQSILVPEDRWQQCINVTAHYASGGSPVWSTVRLADDVQFTEAEPNNGPSEANAIGSALGLNGLLEQAGDRDVYRVSGIKDRSYRVSALTRSLGSPTLLKMTMRNAAGEIIGKSAVGDADEWLFDVKFAADGEYTLEVEDLLHRGGPEHAYHVTLGPAAPFTLALKPDAKTLDRLPLQPTRGASVLDVQIERGSYSGPIELRFEPAVAGLKILNPIIPADTKEARIYVLSDVGWNSQALAAVRCVGKSVQAPEVTQAVTTGSLLRLRAPHVPYPAAWQDGLIALASVNDQPPFFELPTSPDAIALPGPVSDGSFILTLKRLIPEFKEAVSLIRSELPPEWSASAKLDKETMTISVKHPVGTKTETPTFLRFLWYGVFNGRGQIVESSVPVRLFDPLKLNVAPLVAMKAGETQKVQLEILREGADPQPVVIKCQNLPAGVTGPESITIATTDTKAEFLLTAAVESPVGKTGNLTFTAVTKLGAQEITVQSAQLELEVVATAPSN